jgi:hypothetical protein
MAFRFAAARQDFPSGAGRSQRFRAAAPGTPPASAHGSTTPETAMNPVATIPAHALMYQKDQASSHSTRRQGNATQSAFASYGFGPAETQGGDSNKGSVKPTTSSLSQSVPHAMNWITQVQASGTTKT